MLPLIPILASLAPQVIKWIFGDKGAEVTRDVAGVIQTATGIDPTTPEGAAAAQAALAGKPELVAQLQQRLAEIALAREAEANREADARRQAELDDLKQRLTDVAGARTQTTTLAASRSPLAYGSAILSGIILLSFGTLLVLVVNSNQAITNSALANVMLGTLAAMATQVANYWLGSSSGSAHKNDMLADAQAALAASSPVPPVALNASPSVTETPTPGQGTDRSRAATATSSTGSLTADDLNERSLAAARSGR